MSPSSSPESHLLSLLDPPYSCASVLIRVGFVFSHINMSYCKKEEWLEIKLSMLQLFLDLSAQSCREGGQRHLWRRMSVWRILVSKSFHPDMQISRYADIQISRYAAPPDFALPPGFGYLQVLNLDP